MVSAHQTGKDLKVDILPQLTRDALKYLARQSWLKRTDWYLAGGTALALHEGHRKSVDLDFFTPRSDFALGKLQDHFPKRIWKTTTDALLENAGATQ